jgi:DNA-binding response OmpR family regulator
LLKKEYDLLVQLLLADGKACSSKALLLNLWGEAGLASPTILDVYLESISQKLSADDLSPRLQLCADDVWRLLEGGEVSA